MRAFSYPSALPDGSAKVVMMLKYEASNAVTRLVEPALQDVGEDSANHALGQDLTVVITESVTSRQTPKRWHGERYCLNIATGRLNRMQGKRIGLQHSTKGRVAPID